MKKILYISEVPEMMVLWDKSGNNLGLASQTSAKNQKVKVSWICTMCKQPFTREPNNVYKRLINYPSEPILCKSCTKRNNGVKYITRRIQQEGSFATNHPDKVSCWDYEENAKHPIRGLFLPTQFLSSSNETVYWHCPDCGYKWLDTIINRANAKYPCPECYNRNNANLRFGSTPISVTHPYLLEKWHPDNEVSLTDITAHDSTKRIRWRCERGHVWKQILTYMVNTTDKCPICQKEAQTSFPEQAIIFYLQQCTTAINRYKDGKELDIYFPSLNVGIEYDGNYYHPKSKRSKEIEKDDYFRDKGVLVYRIKEAKVNDVDGRIIYYRKDSKYSNLPFVIHTICNMFGLPDIDVDINRDRIAIMDNYVATIKANSIKALRPELMEEWDYEKNQNLKPEFFSPGSDTAVWWKCAKNHSWQVPISSRKDTGCPFCAGVRFIPGETDLQTMRPDLAAEWVSEMNDKKPSEVAANEHYLAYWRCSKGHVWQAMVYSRNSGGTGCNKCADKKRQDTRLKTLVAKNGSLADNYPDLLLEWDWDKNNQLGIDPNKIPPRIRKTVWWKCQICGHKWEKSPDQRIGKLLGCPICDAEKTARKKRLRLVKERGSIKETHPKLMLDWVSSENGIPPEELIATSHERINWKCHICGHKWASRLYKRAENGHRCPECKGKNLP